MKRMTTRTKNINASLGKALQLPLLLFVNDEDDNDDELVVGWWYVVGGGGHFYCRRLYIDVDGVRVGGNRKTERVRLA